MPTENEYNIGKEHGAKQWGIGFPDFPSDSSISFRKIIIQGILVRHGEVDTGN